MPSLPELLQAPANSASANAEAINARFLINDAFHLEISA
jgi:hypothetical protein